MCVSNMFVFSTHSVRPSINHSTKKSIVYSAPFECEFLPLLPSINQPSINNQAINRFCVCISRHPLNQQSTLLSLVIHVGLRSRCVYMCLSWLHPRVSSNPASICACDFANSYNKITMCARVCYELRIYNQMTVHAKMAA